MLWIEYGPVTSKLDSDDKRERREAYDLLSKRMAVKVEGAFFTDIYQKGLWDGTAKFFNAVSGRFQSGLLYAIVKHLRAEELEVEIRNYPEPHPGWEDLTRIELNDSKMGTLSMDLADPVRDYQMEAVRQGLRWTRGILKLATNGGKTEVASAILKILGAPICVFIVPTRELLYQTRDRIQERLGVPVGIVGDNNYKPNVTGITVAMFQTLHKHYNAADKRWLDSVEVLFCDECHYLMGASYQKCVQRIPARFRLGLSATPFEGDLLKRVTVTGYLGPVIAKANNAKLMDKGVSVRPSMLILEPNILENEREKAASMNYDEAVSTCQSRNMLIASLATSFVKSGRQTLIMVNRIAHANTLKKLLPEAIVVTGQSKGKKRDLVKEALAEGRIFCCITTVFTTGISVDYIEGMIFAAGGVDPIRLLQSIGRTVRKAKDVQKDVWIVDFYDAINRYTRKHSRARRAKYESEQAFVITENLCDAPVELQEGVPSHLVSSKNLQRSLKLS